MLKLAVIGSRKYKCIENIAQYMRMLIPQLRKKHGNNLIIVSGGAKGVDTFATLVAGYFNVKIKVFPAQWGKYGLKAGFKRNQQIVDYSDEMLAFWDGSSNGTKDSIDRAKKKGIPVTIVEDK